MFISVPEERFITDIMKTWLSYFVVDANFSGVDILTRFPDVDKDFKVPCLVMRRVKEDWALTRLSGYHGVTKPIVPESATLGRLMGYTYTASYQFDLVTMSISEMNHYSALIKMKLQSAVSQDVFADIGGAVQTVIPVQDFPSPTITGVPTDLKMRFRFARDVEFVEVESFDKELHQMSITVDFWCDYLKEYELPKINAIDTNVNIPDMPV